MRHEDEDGQDVETTPSWVFQDLVLAQKMSLTGTNGTLRSSVQKNVKVINQLACQSEQHQTSDTQTHLTAHQSLRQFQVPRSLQSNKDVQQGAQQHILLDDVCLETESCPVQAHVEKAVRVEGRLVPRTREDFRQREQQR